MLDARKDIRDIPVDSLIGQLQAFGLPKFRCQQIGTRGKQARQGRSSVLEGKWLRESVPF